MQYISYKYALHLASRISLLDQLRQKKSSKRHRAYTKGRTHTYQQGLELRFQELLWLPAGLWVLDEQPARVSDWECPSGADSPEPLQLEEERLREVVAHRRLCRRLLLRPSPAQPSGRPRARHAGGLVGEVVKRNDSGTPSAVQAWGRSPCFAPLAGSGLQHGV